MLDKRTSHPQEVLALYNFLTLKATIKLIVCSCLHNWMWCLWQIGPNQQHIPLASEVKKHPNLEHQKTNDHTATTNIKNKPYNPNTT